jgi:phosphatidylserine/phosphatidylglycerophosphate/cardiolipin synthase-like enzyme
MHSAAPLFSNAGVPVKIDEKQTFARNKIMIIDRSTLIFGSFNFTNTAEENIVERLLIIKGKKLVVKKLADYLEKHKEKLSPYQR